VIKFGLLGCGRIAKRHFDLFGGGHIPGAELVAVCDEVRERTDAIAARFSVPAFYNIDQFLGRKDIQAVWVIEDCAQAHLARYKGQQLGAMGDAGAIVTGRSDLAERMAMLARHGGLVKHQHQIEGINSRLDGLQAAILSAKLAHLARWTQARQATAVVYNAGSLPMFAEITGQQQKTLVDLIRAFG
jgi:dTDP-4-amino-4,6-dideoxygalactose transaminase